VKYLIYVIIISLIIFRYFSSLPKFVEGDKVKISATILSEPIQYSNSQYLKLYGLKIYLPKYPQVGYGDSIVLIGQVNQDKLVGLESVQIEKKKSNIYYLREKIISFYKKSLPEPYSSLVAGMVLGSKQMPQSFWEKLKMTGTAHVVVASGTNVAMFGGFLMSLGALLFKRKQALIMVFLGICIYIVLSGFDAPIVRAGIMGIVAFGAQESGRLISAWKALLYSVLLMLLVKPDWLFDLGFILSVLATSGILLFNKKFEKLFAFVPKVLREGLTTSISAQIFVAPVIFVTFGQFNILSPLINALILWTVPYIMIIGGVGAVIGIIMPEIGQIILVLVYPLTWWFASVIDLCINIF